jgi:hypothetical protein
MIVRNDCFRAVNFASLHEPVKVHMSVDLNKRWSLKRLNSSMVTDEQWICDISLKISSQRYEIRHRPLNLVPLSFLNLRSGDAWLEHRSARSPDFKPYVVFRSPFKQVLGECHNYSKSFQTLFQFIIHQSFYNSTLYGGTCFSDYRRSSDW